MAIKVRYRRDGRVYLLLGTGFGAYKSARPGVFIGDLVPIEDEGQIEMVAVCDGNGNVRWAPSSEVEVVEVDGSAPADLLA